MKQSIKEFITLVEGKKTYIIMCSMVVFAVIGVQQGILDQTKAFEIILESLGLGALRAAIRK